MSTHTSTTTHPPSICSTSWWTAATSPRRMSMWSRMKSKRSYQSTLAILWLARQTAKKHKMSQKELTFLCHTSSTRISISWKLRSSLKGPVLNNSTLIFLENRVYAFCSSISWLQGWWVWWVFPTRNSRAFSRWRRWSSLLWGCLRLEMLIMGIPIASQRPTGSPSRTWWVCSQVCWEKTKERTQSRRRFESTKWMEA